MFKITLEWLEAHKTNRGGYNYAQIALIGEPNPPKKGWKLRAAGREISDEAKAAFEELAEGKSYGERRKIREALGVAKPRKSRQQRKLDRMAAKSAKPDPYVPEKTYFAYSIPDPEFAKSDAFLNTYEWRRLRMEVLKKYGAKCQCCGATAEDGVRINVDHIKPRRTHPHLCLDIRNLQVLCNPCNHGKGNWDRTDWRPAYDKIEAEYSAEAVAEALRRIK